jgi:hypothetical protein
MGGLGHRQGLNWWRPGYSQVKQMNYAKIEVE